MATAIEGRWSDAESVGQVAWAHGHNCVSTTSGAPRQRCIATPDRGDRRVGADAPEMRESGSESSMTASSSIPRDVRRRGCLYEVKSLKRQVRELTSAAVEAWWQDTACKGWPHHSTIAWKKVGHFSLGVVPFWPQTNRPSCVPPNQSPPRSGSLYLLRDNLDGAASTSPAQKPALFLTQGRFAAPEKLPQWLGF